MSDLDRIKLRDIAWNFIANNDESAKHIPDGEIDMGSEFLADFAEHLEAKRLEYVKCTKQALHKHIVSQRSELLAFKDWFNSLPDESDDRFYITDETIDRFKANCG